MQVDTRKQCSPVTFSTVAHDADHGRYSSAVLNELVIEVAVGSKGPSRPLLGFKAIM